MFIGTAPLNLCKKGIYANNTLYTVPNAVVHIVTSG